MDDGDDDDDFYNERRHSINGSEFTSSPSYDSGPPVILGAYSSYGYPASTTPHSPYAPNYTYGNQPHATPNPQSYTTNEVRSPTAYRSQYSNAEYSTAYSSTPATTPAITYTHAPAPSLTTSTDYWNTPHHGHESYGNSNNHSPAGYTTPNGLIRTPSQRSDGNRSQTSNDG